MAWLVIIIYAIGVPLTYGPHRWQPQQSAAASAVARGALLTKDYEERAYFWELA